MLENRNIGGVTCFEVLAQLSDYVDGELSAEARVKIETHLAGCDACTRFGGEFGAVVTALRQKLKAPRTG
ncbi:MAG: zf-HC2 domain-containing protein [Archangium sp.]|nr:zf-HC2 domain-containing protein [Archangium sp.]